MKKYKRLTEKDKNGKNSIDCGKKCPNYENCNCSIFTCNKFIINRLAELEDKIEQQEMVSIKDVVKLFNKIWECPCDYIFDDEDVNEVICKNVGEDWCEKNCPTEWDDYTKCWEQYIKAKLKELKGEV